jgi:hypothetical protein
MAQLNLERSFALKHPPLDAQVAHENGTPRRPIFIGWPAILVKLQVTRSPSSVTMNLNSLAETGFWLRTISPDERG